MNIGTSFTSIAIFGLLVLTGPLPCRAQAPSDSKPAATNARGSEYPRVHADGRVTFRLVAPAAQKVQVQFSAAGGEPNGCGVAPFDMTKGKDGAWTVTIPPCVPGFHYYTLLIDGVEVSDPSSESFIGYNKSTSAVEVPDPAADFYLAKDVPHGEIRENWFHSKLTAEWRQSLVYTPPGYDSSRQRYPVLYLQHGGGGNVTVWARQGHVDFILDNLIAAGKAKPMIVVMNTGYAFRPDEIAPPAGAPVPPRSTFEQLILTEVVPTIDAKYRTLADRDHRAIAGISLGGRQALQIALAHLDVFSHVGAFSRPVEPEFNPATSFDGVFKDAAAFNKKVHVLWFGAGTAERAIHDSAKATHEALDKAGIKNVFVEFPGTSHEWQTWRKALNDFAPRLFR